MKTSIIFLVVISFVIVNCHRLRKQNANDWQKVFGANNKQKAPQNEAIVEYNKFFEMVSSKQKNSFLYPNSVISFLDYVANTQTLKREEMATFIKILVYRGKIEKKVI